MPILVGGDDSVPIPMLEALSATGQTYSVLQIDAHIDWRKSHMDEEFGLASTMRRASEMSHIERIVQVGARGIGSTHSDDHADAVAWGADFFTAHDTTGQVSHPHWHASPTARTSSSVSASTPSTRPSCPA